MVIFPLAPDQTIAQMWSNGARGGAWERSPSGYRGIAPMVGSRTKLFYTKEGPKVNTFNVISGYCCACVSVFCDYCVQASASPYLWSVGPLMPGSASVCAVDAGFYSIAKFLVKI